MAAGLQQIEDLAAGSAKAVGKDNSKAEQLHSGIESEWEKIEDTVRANDSSTYVALEDSFTLLKIAAKAADPAKASKASEGLSAAVDSYLGKHPGGEGSTAGAASASSPEAGSSRTAAAASSTTPAPAEGASAEGATSGGTLARTGPGSGHLSVLAGTVLGLGGLAFIGGARRRTRPVS